MSTKILSLFAGIFQQTALVLIIRYSKTIHVVAKDADPDTPPYLTSVAVASAEVIKIFLSCFLETMNRHSSSSGEQTIIFSVVKQMTKKLATRDGTKLIPVAILYLIQNNLLFVALSNISVPVYQITNQGKLITTTLISRVLLKKQITTMQYIAILLLGLGLCIANLSQYGVSISSSDSRIFDEILSTKSGQNPWLGISAVLISCITSAFAGVYFEYVFKKQNATQSKDQKENESIHSRNFQLSCWSFFFAVMIIFYSDRDVIFEYGMFHKFDGVVVLTIISQAMSGFVASLMIAYASAILKSFAISIAALLATVLSVFIFDTELSSGFLVGAALVGFSTRLYLRYDDIPTNDDQSKKTVDISQAIVRCRVFSGKFQKVYLMCIVMITIWSFLGINHYLVSNDNNNFYQVQNQEVQNQADKLKKYPLRDLSPFNGSYVESLPTHMADANCMYFRCNKNVTHCDNDHVTNYDGPEPPCCTHIMRDMTQIYDESMALLGLDYSVAFGTLLGFVRSDRIIPWTSDIDFIIEDTKTAHAMTILWNVNATGISLIFQNILRACANPSFAGGKLDKWSIPPPLGPEDVKKLNGENATLKVKADRFYDRLDFRKFPYIDFYVGKNISQHPDILFSEFGRCRHLYEDVFPTKRSFVCNNSFALNFPANPEQMLRTYYGLDWKTPPLRKKPHGGGGGCPFGPRHGRCLNSSLDLQGECK